MKVETDIIASLAGRPIVVMYVRIFKAGVIVIVVNVIKYLTDNIQYQCKFIDTEKSFKMP